MVDVVDVIDQGVVFGYQVGDYQVCGCVQVGCYDWSVFEFGYVGDDGGVVFDEDLCVYVVYFVNMYEVVFEDCFDDCVGVFGYCVYGDELGLYVGGECWVWCGMYVDCFWLVVFYVQFDLVVVGVDVGIGFFQFLQDCFEDGWIGIF